MPPTTTQLKHGYDGINFDLELGGFGPAEEKAYAAMIVQLQSALTAARGPSRPIAPVSACIGDAKNSLAAPAGVQAAPDGQALLYDMGTYDSGGVAFVEELAGALERIKLTHLTVGLSASTDSWKKGAPTEAELGVRFKALGGGGVERVALFGTEYLDAYVPFLRTFLHGGSRASPDAPDDDDGSSTKSSMEVSKDRIIHIQALPRPPFSWDTLPVFFHSANASGPWSDAAVKQIARFAMATNEKAHAMALPGGGRQSEEIAGPAACRQVDAQKTGSHTFFYLNSVIDWPFNFKLHDLMVANPSWRLKVSGSERNCDSWLLTSCHITQTHTHTYTRIKYTFY